MKMPWSSVFLFFIILFRTNGKKDLLDENKFRQAYGNYFEVQLWKLIDISYVQSSFSTITRNIDNAI